MNNSFITTITNAYNNNCLSHAYLLEGNVLDNSIYFLVSGFLGALANEEIITQLKNRNIPAVIWLDGKVNGIKKQDIVNIINHISLSGTKICILENVDLASTSALNSLLKALEEPDNKNVKFLLTTSNKDNVLETIISRCQLFSIEDESAIEYSEEISNIVVPLLEAIYNNNKYLALSQLSLYSQYDDEFLFEIINYLILKIHEYLYKNPSINLSIWYVNLVELKQEFNFNIGSNILLANCICQILEALDENSK